MYILKDEDSLEFISKQYLNYDRVDELEVSFDFSNLNDCVDESGYIKKSWIDSEISIDVSVIDPEDDLNDGDEYSIYVPMLELVEKEI